jgi:hypothetical protein
MAAPNDAAQDLARIAKQHATPTQSALAWHLNQWAEECDEYSSAENLLMCDAARALLKGE